MQASPQRSPCQWRAQSPRLNWGSSSVCCRWRRWSRWRWTSWRCPGPSSPSCWPLRFSAASSFHQNKIVSKPTLVKSICTLFTWWSWMWGCWGWLGGGRGREPSPQSWRWADSPGSSCSCPSELWCTPVMWLTWEDERKRKDWIFLYGMGMSLSRHKLYVVQNKRK